MEDKKTYSNGSRSGTAFKRKPSKLLKGYYKESISGIQDSKSGDVQYLSFALLAEGKEYCVTAFNDEARRSILLNRGEPVKVYGRYDEGEDEEGRQKFLADSVGMWDPVADQKKRARDYAIKMHGTLEKYYASERAWTDLQRSKGLRVVVFSSGVRGWVDKRYCDGAGGLLVDRILETDDGTFTKYVREHFTTENPVTWLPYLLEQSKKRGIATFNLSTSGRGMESRDRANPGAQAEGQRGQEHLDKNRPPKASTAAILSDGEL